MRLFTKGDGNFKCTFCSLYLHCLLSFEILEIKFISNISHNDKNNFEKDEKKSFFYIVVNT